MRSVVPARRFDALRAFAGAVLPSRLAPDGGPPCAFAPLQRSITAPPHGPAGPKTGMSDDASSPGLLDPSTRHGTADPSIRGASCPAACRVRGLGTSFAASTAVPLDALRRRSVHGLHPSRPSPRADGCRSRGPCPPVVPRVGSPRPHGGGRTRAPSGLRSRSRARAAAGPPKGPGASMPSWASPVQSVPSPRPGVPLWIAEPPLARVRRRDVHVRRRQRVFGYGGIGWSLSGLPALLGFLTLRPSRRRSVRHGGRAHGFASRSGRVASGPNRSVPPRERTSRSFRTGPAPPSFGERLAASSDRQSLVERPDSLFCPTYP
jgi:hypothetical protein